MKTVKAIPLKGNRAGDRWQFVILENGAPIWSTRFCYGSEEDAMMAGSEYLASNP